MNILAPRLEQRDPDLNKGMGLAAVPFEVELNGNTRLALFVLFAAVSCLLLISCANAAHLMLARGASREREMAVRMALGAGRADLIRQLAVESITLSLLAGCLGLLLAEFGVRGLVAYGPRDLPRLEQAGLDAGVLIFAFAVSLLAAIFFGLVPGMEDLWCDPQRVLEIEQPRLIGRHCGEPRARSAGDDGVRSDGSVAHRRRFADAQSSGGRSRRFRIR